MVKIEYRPIEKFIVGEYVQLRSIEELARPLGFYIGIGQITGLNWAEGIVFMFGAMNPTTDTLQKEYLDGKLYCPSIPFVIMPEFQPTIKTPEGLNVPVIDVSLYPSLKELALWLKRQIE